MKKYALLLIAISLFGCNKNDNNNPVTLNCKPARMIHRSGGAVDTTIITYSGEDIYYVYAYSNSTVRYSYKYIKSGNQYNFERYTDSVKSMQGTYYLNSQGLVDTGQSMFLPGMNFNDRDRYYYDANKNAIRAITNYNTYENDVKYHYSNGNYSYWIYDFTNFTTPSASTKDSVTFEYYMDKPKKAPRYATDLLYGNLEKNLVKKRSYYDLLNAGALRRTYEYEYVTDANGLISREIWTIKNQPGDIVIRRDTTDLEYFCY